MKKSLKLLAALGMLSMLISVVACDMPTEDQLLGATAKEGEEAGSSSGDSKDSASSTGTKSPLWSKFEGADMQVWVIEGTTTTTADVSPKSDCIEIAIKSAGWWGMCFCNDKAVGAGPNAVTFDMSQVASITFEAKASQTASMWVGQMPSGLGDKQRVELSTDFAEKTFTLSNPTNHDYGVLAIGGGDLDTTVTTGVKIYIKNIKFLNAAGTEIVPTRNE